MRSTLFIFMVLNVAGVFAQKKANRPAEQEGPVMMLGYVDFREANVWVMHHEKTGFIQYWSIDQPDLKYSLNPSTSKAINRYMVSTFKAGPLEPGKTYCYKYSNGVRKSDNNYPFYTFTTPELWRWRKSAPDFKVALGSCNYVNQPGHERPGKLYGDTATGIFDNIAAKKPDLMLWLGDNVYLREPDWGSETGINERYIHVRKQSSLWKLYVTCPNLAIWDDHDYGPNDANSSFYNKEKTLQAFRDFWPNTGSSISGIQGITYAFDYQDVHFLMLDDRYNRTPDFCDSCPEETILGKAQLEWLKLSLLSTPGSEFKVVCIGGQFLNSVQEFEVFSRWEWERNDIIEFIYRNNIRNVVFLSGDRHFSELSVVHKEGKPTIYDFTVSPLTSGVFKKVNELNKNRVEGSLYAKDRNFGVLEFRGKDKERTVRFLLYDKQGEEVYHFEFLRE